MDPLNFEDDTLHLDPDSPEFQNELQKFFDTHECLFGLDELQYGPQEIATNRTSFNRLDVDGQELAPEEVSRLLRAKRNREAAHRSRTKNKQRQQALESETRRLLKLHNELRGFLCKLLVRFQSEMKAENVASSVFANDTKVRSNSVSMESQTQIKLKTENMEENMMTVDES